MEFVFESKPLAYSVATSVNKIETNAHLYGFLCSSQVSLAAILTLLLQYAM
jgi:hypothetical protein